MSGSCALFHLVCSGAGLEVSGDLLRLLDVLLVLFLLFLVLALGVRPLDVGAVGEVNRASVDGRRGGESGVWEDEGVGTLL